MRKRWFVRSKIQKLVRRVSKILGSSTMNKGTRACVAYITGKAISGRNTSHVYDYERSTYVTISGTVGSSVSVYDYERGCFVSGSGGSQMSLYDFGNSGHVTLTISGNQFNGYDFGSNAHFSGSVNGNSVAVYDYQSSTWHNYSL